MEPGRLSIVDARAFFVFLNTLFIFREREREREEQGGAKGEEGGREMQLTYFTTWLNEDRLLMYILGFSVM